MPETPRAIPSGRRVAGRLAVPPSKSVTNRYLTLALLAGRPLVIDRPLESEDTTRLRAALEVCGFEVRSGEERLELVPGAPPSGGDVFCGASGTMLRFLTAALAAVPGRWRLDGIPRLRERPVGPLVEALRRLGARIDCPQREGFAPLVIEGATLRGGTTTLDAESSSQFLSALLMAALAAPSPTRVKTLALTSEPYVEITLAAIEAFGGRVERLGDGSFEVHPSLLDAGRLRVEGDYSAACYPAAAAALTGGEVTLLELLPDSRQGDRGFLAVLARMGAEVVWRDGELTVAGGGLRGVEIDLSAMPDQVPTLAALAPFASGTTRIHNVPHLRLKESDRLAAMAAELSRAGARVEEEPAGLGIAGVWASAAPPENPVVLQTHGDHRIAMACALVGLRRPGVCVATPGVVDKSYPGFWRDLETLLRS